LLCAISLVIIVIHEDTLIAHYIAKIYLI